MGDVAQVPVKLSWREKFIAQSLIPNPIPGLDPGSTRGVEPELYISSSNTTLRPQLRSRR